MNGEVAHPQMLRFMNGFVTYPSTAAGPLISFLEVVDPARIGAKAQALAPMDKAYSGNFAGGVLGRHISSTRC